MYYVSLNIKFSLKSFRKNIFKNYRNLMFFEKENWKFFSMQILMTDHFYEFFIKFYSANSIASSFSKLKENSIKLTLFIFMLKKSIWWTVYGIMIWIYLETHHEKKSIFMQNDTINNLMSITFNFETHQMNIGDASSQCTITDKLYWLKSQFYNYNEKLAMHHSHVDHIQCRIFQAVLWILLWKMCQNNPRSKPCCFTSHLYLTIQKTVKQILDYI